jgi:hypothetical protein
MKQFLCGFFIVYSVINDMILKIIYFIIFEFAIAFACIIMYNSINNLICSGEDSGREA